MQGHTHACEPWARKRAGCSQHRWAMCLRKKLHQPFLADPASCLPNKATWLGLGRSSLSRHAAHASQQRGGCSGTNWGEFGSNTGWGKTKGEKALFYSFNTVPSRKIRIGGSRLLQIKGTRSFQVKKGGSLSSIRRVGSLKSSKLSRQDSESEAEELQLCQSRDTVTDLGNIEEWGVQGRGG